jgi:hypothetical protein
MAKFECSICGNRPNELKLLDPTYGEGDECPCQFVDWEGKAKGKCGGKLIAVGEHFNELQQRTASMSKDDVENDLYYAHQRIFHLKRVARQMHDLLWRVHGGEARISSYQLHSWERKIEEKYVGDPPR